MHMRAVSYQNPGLNYATAQKLVAVPAYTQAAYRPLVAPTAATAASAYTNAYVQPTGVAPVKVCNFNSATLHYKKKNVC